MNGLFRNILLIALMIIGPECPSSPAGLTFHEEAPDGYMEAALYGDYEGYMDAIPFRGLFLAVGTGGRIDFIDASGARIRTCGINGINLNCAAVWDQVAVVAGD